MLNIKLETALSNLLWLTHFDLEHWTSQFPLTSAILWLYETKKNPKLLIGYVYYGIDFQKLFSFKI